MQAQGVEETPWIKDQWVDWVFIKQFANISCLYDAYHVDMVVNTQLKVVKLIHCEMESI